ncbi:MAG: BON domain-containing protein [Paraburkholderia tropica]|uniref:Hyperosmotically inducible protein n=1 Tax=Paraburkholderia tropica TaxID=92647 RepID=A0AAQ1JY79_9BURK|nr:MULTISPECIES: BON domain-containing protein [Paraburkholderia]MDE1138537.1 BON domain-containing protein [Paraburkholderia tropica]PXX06421.1 hyperosmotically inducible protein [Paraburkholderia tropica]PZW72155.1 hyperosmotically inducible protein [Paraburkholderia tropica]QNB13269.1 BON domain-containing protein [Paraburkholderia tropica]RQM46271.1 BON domain-containing protein [Paraburkholderia bannensis]
MKSDIELKRDVEAEFAWDKSINPAEIGVGVSNGVVTLSGHPASFAQKLAAERAAARVAGVRGIVVEMEVRLARHDVRSDEDIADTVRSILEWTVGLNNQMVQARVEKGWVTLMGECDWSYQSHAAKNAIAHLLGVTGVTDTIRVRGEASAEDIAVGIRDAIQRHGDREAKHIGIEIDDGTAILTGKVASNAERRLVFGAAKATSGVRAVVDLLEIG